MNKFALLLGAALMIAPKIYPQTAVVTDVDRWNVITVKTFCGFEYTFPDDAGDWFEGDICSMIMDDNGTEDDITDDRVMDTRCGGWIDNWEDWFYED